MAQVTFKISEEASASPASEKSESHASSPVMSRANTNRVGQTTSDGAEELLKALAQVIRSYQRQDSASSARAGRTLSPTAESDVVMGRDDYEFLGGADLQPSLSRKCSSAQPGIIRSTSGLPVMATRSERLQFDHAAFVKMGRTRSIGAFNTPAEETEHRHLEELECDADFWCDLVANSPAPRGLSMTPRGFQGVEGGESISNVRENVLEEFFDLTPERVIEIYVDILREDNGTNFEEILDEGFKRCGLSGLGLSVPKRILQAVVLNKDGRLQPAEFETVLSRLKLAQLLTGLFRQERMPGKVAFRECHGARRLTVIDYDTRSCEVMVFTEARLKSYFFGHRPEPQDIEKPGVRWIHLAGLELTLMLSLTVKYSLHPLAVEDVLEQCRTKVDRYGDHFFAAVEKLSLVDPDGADGSSPVQVVGSHIAIFCAGLPNLDTVITVSQPDETFPKEWPGYSSADDPGETPPSDGSPTAGEGCDEWVVRLRQRLQSSHSRLRERRSHFLLVQVLDLCTDELVCVTHAYTARLGRLETDLHEHGAQLEWKLVKEMSLIRLQLAVVSRRARGMLRAIRNLDDPDIREDLMSYLRDIMDHLDEANDDAAILAEKCGAMLHAYERMVERMQDQARQETGDRLNNTLFLLTGITTVLMPLQLVAGVYGMNFMDIDGRPTIPELTWPRGYMCFLVFSAVYLVASTVFTWWLYFQVQNKSKVAPKMEKAASGLLGKTVGPPARLQIEGRPRGRSDVSSPQLPGGGRLRAGSESQALMTGGGAAGRRRGGRSASTYL